MPQTLMALLAMMTVTLASINQQRTLIQTHRAMLDDEMEVMASGVALQAIEYIQTKGFDEATLAGPVNDPEDLTSIFSTGKRCALSAVQEGANGYDTCNDVSDYNGETEWETIPFSVGDATVDFQVKAEVAYVDDIQNRIDDPSFFKEVVVTVRQLPQNGRPALLRQPVTVARTISY